MVTGHQSGLLGRFGPSALTDQPENDQLRTVFRVEADWSRATAEVSQVEEVAQISVSGSGDLEAAGIQVCRFLSLDSDGLGWIDVAHRDAVIADAQRQLPGLRPCGFHSPYEAAAWSVLSQRIRITQGARLRDDIVDRYGEDGAFPAPRTLRHLDLDLPGRRPNTCTQSRTLPSEGNSMARRYERSTRTKSSGRTGNQGPRTVRGRTGRPARGQRTRRPAAP